MISDGDISSICHLFGYSLALHLGLVFAAYDIANDEWHKRFRVLIIGELICVICSCVALFAMPLSPEYDIPIWLSMISMIIISISISFGSFDMSYHCTRPVIHRCHLSFALLALIIGNITTQSLYVASSTYNGVVDNLLLWSLLIMWNGINIGLLLPPYFALFSNEGPLACDGKWVNSNWISSALCDASTPSLYDQQSLPTSDTSQSMPPLLFYTGTGSDVPYDHAYESQPQVASTPSVASISIGRPTILTNNGTNKAVDIRNHIASVPVYPTVIPTPYAYPLPLVSSSIIPQAAYDHAIVHNHTNDYHRPLLADPVHHAY